MGTHPPSEGDSMKKITVTRLADLRAGDRLVSLDGRVYTSVRIVAQSLGYIGAGAVQGVRLVNPFPSSDVEHVFYPSQMDGHRIEIERNN